MVSLMVRLGGDSLDVVVCGVKKLSIVWSCARPRWSSCQVNLPETGSNWFKHDKICGLLLVNEDFV